MKKWKRSLGTSKKEQGIVTPKRPPYRKHAFSELNARLAINKLLSRSWEALSERVKARIAYDLSSKEERLKMELRGYQKYQV